jgi:hypothetical protein
VLEPTVIKSKAETLAPILPKERIDKLLPSVNISKADMCAAMRPPPMMLKDELNWQNDLKLKLLAQATKSNELKVLPKRP